MLLTERRYGTVFVRPAGLPAISGATGASNSMNRPGLKTALAVLKLMVSAGLLTLLFSRTDTRSVFAQFRQMNLAWTVAALSMYALMLCVSAWRWRLLLRVQTVEVGLGTLTRSFLVATFFNNFLPSNIGGDVVRVADTAPFARSKTLATTVVLLDRVLGLVALLALAAIGSAFAMGAGIRVQGMQYIWIALVIMAAGLIVAFRNPDQVSRALRAIARGRAEKLQGRLHNIVVAVERFADQPRALWFAFVGAIGVQFLIVLFYVCAAHSLAVPLTLMAASLIVPVSLVVQMVPVSINGFGVREAVFAFFFTSLGLKVSSALTLSLGSAALIMLFSLSGGAVFLFRPRRQEFLGGGVLPESSNP
jgi:glycosyltransferase 2 family protein